MGFNAHSQLYTCIQRAQYTDGVEFAGEEDEK